MGSLYSPAKYTKSEFSIVPNSPTEASSLNSHIFSDLNEIENDPTHTEENKRSNRKVNLNGGNAIEDDKLKSYTAIPTHFSPSKKQHQFRYDPKTTPEYKRYTYEVVDSANQENVEETKNTNDNANQDDKKVDKAGNSLQKGIDKGQTLLNNVTISNDRRTLPKFQYRITPQTTSPTLSTPRVVDPLGDHTHYNVLHQANVISSNFGTGQENKTRSKILQGYFDSEDFKFPLVHKDRLKTLPSTAETILAQYTKDRADNDLQNEISKTILPPGALRSLPEQFEIYPTLSLEHHRDLSSVLNQTEEAPPTYHDPQGTKHLGKYNQKSLYTPHPDPKYTYALQSQFFVPHEADAETTATTKVERSSTYTVSKSTTPSTFISKNAAGGQHLEEIFESRHKNDSIEQDQEGIKRYSYTVHSTQDAKTESRDDTRMASKSLHNDGDDRENPEQKYGYKLISQHSLSPNIVTENPREQEARRSKSIQTTSSTIQLPQYTQMSQFFIPFEEDKHSVGENDAKKYTYHFVSQNDKKRNKNANENFINSTLNNRKDIKEESLRKFTYALGNGPPQPSPTEPISKYTYAIHSNPSALSPTKSSNTSFDDTEGEMMATSNSLPHFTYSIKSTPATASYANAKHIDAELRDESHYHASTPLALGHYSIGNGLATDTTSTSWLHPDPAKGLGLPKYRVNQLPLTTRTQPYYSDDGLPRKFSTKRNTYRVLTSTSPIPPLFYGDTIVIDHNHSKKKNRKHEKQPNHLDNHVHSEDKIPDPIYHPEQAPLLKDMFPNTAEEVSSLINGAFGTKIVPSEEMQKIMKDPSPTTLNLTIITPSIVRKITPKHLKFLQYNRRKKTKPEEGFKDKKKYKHHRFSELDEDESIHPHEEVDDHRYDGVEEEFGNHYHNGEKKQRVPYTRHGSKGKLEEQRQRFRTETKAHIQRIRLGGDKNESVNNASIAGTKATMIGAFVEEDKTKMNNDGQNDNDVKESMMTPGMNSFEKYMDNKFKENLIPSGKGDENDNASILPRPTEAILKKQPYKIPIAEYEGYELERFSQRYPPAHHLHHQHLHRHNPQQHQHYHRHHHDPKKYVNPSVGKVTSVSDNVELVELIPKSHQVRHENMNTNLNSNIKSPRPNNEQAKMSSSDKEMKENDINDRHDKFGDEFKYMNMGEMMDTKNTLEEEPEDLIDVRGVPSKHSINLSVEFNNNSFGPTPKTQREFEIEEDLWSKGQTTKASLLPPKSPPPSRLPGIRPFPKNKFLPPMDSPMLRLTIDDDGKTTSEDFLQLPFTTNPPIFPSLSSKSVIGEKKDAYLPTQIPMSNYKKSVQKTRGALAKPPLTSSLPKYHKRPSYKGRSRPPISSSFTPNKYKIKTKTKSKINRAKVLPTYSSSKPIKHKTRGQSNKVKPLNEISEELELETGKYHYSIKTPNSYTSFNLPPRKTDGFTKTPPLPKRNPENPNVSISLRSLLFCRCI